MSGLSICCAVASATADAAAGCVCGGKGGQEHEAGGIVKLLDGIGCGVQVSAFDQDIDGLVGNRVPVWFDGDVGRGLGRVGEVAGFGLRQGYGAVSVAGPLWIGEG